MSSFKAYLPLHALRKIDFESILSIALPQKLDERKVDYHHSRRTLLYYLLSSYEQDADGLAKLLEQYKLRVNWERAKADYNYLKDVTEPYQVQNGAKKLGKYWELQKTTIVRTGSKQARDYISRYRQDGFQMSDLKIYWNYDEINQLKDDDKFNPETDNDTNQALKQYPVDQRQNNGTIHFLCSGIEEAIFNVPDNKQIIVLDFADERMPGGYFLENARTQEEVLLYNSDGYRALLDLKYQKMDGGYMLPEFGVAYVKRVNFVQANSMEIRSADLIVAACYDLSGMGEGLYRPPSREMRDKLEEQTYEKFKSIIASGVANSENGGKDTYLLLGPIGTGAFSNDMGMIARLFATVLNENLMDNTRAIKYAFDEIWFVSIDSLTVFKAEFGNYEKHQLSSL